MTRARTAVLSFAAALALLPAAALAQDDPDVEDGQIAFNTHCRTCHVTDEDDHRLGPSLHNIIGREAGSVPGYAHSPAMAAAGVVWDETTLDRFIENPDAVVSGHTMRPYPGVPSAEERARIIGYLKAESEGG